jgi:isoquinoline 1-oxidoreductase alpha subunit
MTDLLVNGEPLRFRLDPGTPLLWALRDAANLTGAKYGCDDRSCGACTVIVDGQAVRSCAVPLATLEGANVVTIEGLSSDRSHPMQRAWEREQVSQCGYCEPGMIMALAAATQGGASLGGADLAAITNICRCGIGPRVLLALARTEKAEGLETIRAEGEPRNSSQFSNGSSDESQSPGQVDRIPTE